MELREFIAETLIAIQQGVADAIVRAEETKTIGRINPLWRDNAGNLDWKDGAQSVEFDVAVTTTDKSTTGGKGSVEVFAIAKLGANGSKSWESSTVSRIKFSIPISPPAHVTDRYK